MRARLKRESGLKQISAPLDPFEAQANRDALVELSGALKVIAVSLTKIAGDLALMGSGPRAGIGELFLPELQKGSSIMPGKVNPVIPEVVLQVSAQVIGNDTAITVGGIAGPVRAQRAHPADRAQPAPVAAPARQRLRACSPRSASTASGQQGRLRRLGRRHARGRHRAERRDRLRQGHGDRQEGHATPDARCARSRLEEGVDAKLYDATIDLKKIAAATG